MVGLDREMDGLVEILAARVVDRLGRVHSVEGARSSVAWEEALGEEVPRRPCSGTCAEVDAGRGVARGPWRLEA